MVVIREGIVIFDDVGVIQALQNIHLFHCLFQVEFLSYPSSYLQCIQKNFFYREHLPALLTPPPEAHPRSPPPYLRLHLVVLYLTPLQPGNLLHYFYYYYSIIPKKSYHLSTIKNTRYIMLTVSVSPFFPCRS